MTGNVITITEDVAAAVQHLEYTSGTIAQLHEHSFPQINTDVTAGSVYPAFDKPAFIVNYSGDPYRLANGITPSMDTYDDVTGTPTSIGNKYYPLVVWGVVSEALEDCQLFFNMPNAAYTAEADALNDADGGADYTIPVQYLGTGFLLTKLVIKRTATTVNIISAGTKDLRGSIPSVGGGSTIGGGGITAFDSLTDTPLSKVGFQYDLVRVNMAESSLEYIDGDTIYVPKIGGAFTGEVAVGDGQLTVNNSVTAISDLANLNFSNTALTDADKRTVVLRAVNEGGSTGTRGGAFELYLREATSGSNFIKPFSIANSGDATFSGNVGIGAAAGRLLEVHNPSADAFIAITAEGVRDNGLLFGNNTSDAQGQIRYRNDTAEMRFVVDTSITVLTLGSSASTFGGDVSAKKLTVDIGGTGEVISLKRATTEIGTIYVSAVDVSLRAKTGGIINLGESGVDADIKFFSSVGQAFIMDGATGNATFSGDVGIGAGTVTQPLHIFNASLARERLEVIGTHYFDVAVNTTEAFLNTNVAIPISFRTNNIEILTVCIYSVYL